MAGKGERQETCKEERVSSPAKKRGEETHRFCNARDKAEVHCMRVSSGWVRSCARQAPEASNRAHTAVCPREAAKCKGLNVDRVLCRASSAKKEDQNPRSSQDSVGLRPPSDTGPEIKRFPRGCTFRGWTAEPKGKLTFVVQIALDSYPQTPQQSSKMALQGVTHIRAWRRIEAQKTMTGGGSSCRTAAVSERTFKQAL